MDKLIPAIEKKNWTDKMWKVYDWIIEWDYCDKEMATYIVGGGSYSMAVELKKSILTYTKLIKTIENTLIANAIIGCKTQIYQVLTGGYLVE